MDDPFEESKVKVPEKKETMDACVRGSREICPGIQW